MRIIIMKLIAHHAGGDPYTVDRLTEKFLTTGLNSDT
jgi:hypothetical protein